MSRKHGAILGLVLAAMAMLGVIGNTSAPHTGVTYPSETGTAAAESSRAVRLDGELVGLLGQRLAEPVVEAAPVRMAKLFRDSEPSSPEKQIYPSDCTEITLKFTASSYSGDAPLTVNFFNATVLKDGSGGVPNITYIQYFITDPHSADPKADISLAYDATLEPDEQQAQATWVFEEADSYDVGIRVIVTNPADPTEFFACGNSANTDLPFVVNDLIRVSDEGTQEPTANFEAFDLIGELDTQALVPFNDWVPLFAFTMSYPTGDSKPPAYRTLTQLRYKLRSDPVLSGRDYRSISNPSTPQEEHILEFGLFADYGGDGDAPNQLFELGSDGYVVFNTAEGRFQKVTGSPMLTWDNHGYPYEMPDIETGAYIWGDGTYNLNFTFDPSDEVNFNATQPYDNSNPKFPFVVWDPFGFPRLNWVISAAEPHRGYIVAARLSSAWPCGQTLSYQVLDARMQPYDFRGAIAELNVDGAIVEPRVDPFPLTDDWKPADSYSPDFYGSPKDILSEDSSYSSSCDVYDLTGDLFGSYVPGNDPVAGLDHNRWSWPNKLYTPAGEFARMRWDKGETAFEMMLGEWMDIRRLFSVEQWTPVLGLNMHGSCTDQPVEFNIICTDIGGDPYGPPGNGGFDPTDGLDTFTTDTHGGPHSAIGVDYSFNGVWVYHDTAGGDNCGLPNANCDGNGVWDAPTPNGTTGGVSFIDHPMYPNTEADNWAQGGINEWEYVPFPPGGGDPWWKIKILLSGGRRRDSSDTCRGYFEATPDPDPDYFVVIRPDSGTMDVSGFAGDGTGLALGADTRVFIEPRRWNPDGHWDGGIWLSNQVGAGGCGCGTVDDEKQGGGVSDYPQDNPQYDWISLDPTSTTADFRGPLGLGAEPWWHERTHVRDNVKPIRSGVEVHDYVLTYSTYNRYAKVTIIMPSQLAVINGITMDKENVPGWGYGGGGTFASRTNFSIWADPPLFDRADFLALGVINPIPMDNLGIFNIRFLGLWSPGVQPDSSEGAGSVDDQLNSIQYSFETAPFELGPEGSFALLNDPRSTYFPDPQDQPILPTWSTWPPSWPSEPVAMGVESHCYLANEGALSNGPFRDPETSDSEARYEDDEYIYVTEDGNFAGLDLRDHWLIDREGAKYRILSHTNNTLTLEHGHGAYWDDYYLTRTVDENGVTVRERVYIPDFPYGVEPGLENAVERGLWAIVKEGLRRNNIARMSDWPEGDYNEALPEEERGFRAARVLKQYVDYLSPPTAMLGINLAGTEDPSVNSFAKIALNSLTVAFWGPEFDSSDLQKLDEDGELYNSGVLLYEDTNGSGVFESPAGIDADSLPFFTDRIVPLEPGSLKWRASRAEPIDLNGDFEPDDLSGDGVVFLGDVDDPRAEDFVEGDSADWDGLSDEAWVLRLQPHEKWTVPYSDRGNAAAGKSGAFGDAQKIGGRAVWPSFWTQTPTLVDLASAYDRSGGSGKALSEGAHEGDDLFVVIRTSQDISAFEEFRCVVPSKLPTRESAERTAGVEVSPRAYTVVDAYDKLSPDEGAVQDFYGHDMLAVDVPVRVEDLSDVYAVSSIGGFEIPEAFRVALIEPGSPEQAVLGIDVATNREDNLIAYGDGDQAEAALNTFTPSGNDIQVPADSIYYSGLGWTQEAVGLWLVGMSQGEESTARVTAYEVVGVNDNILTLRAGAPRNGSDWYVVKDPTFLEQVVVELYDVGGDGHFDPQYELLPLNHEDPANPITDTDGNVIDKQVSGLALYRDNDWHPSNTNGEYDPPLRDELGQIIEYVDLPVMLDAPPILIGTVGREPEYQVKFVFSSPGTDDLKGRDTVPYTEQPNLRQIVPQTFGLSTTDDNFGSDFFVVLRTSRNMDEGDDFRVAIVSWGPNTPTEPDPDNFTVSLGPDDLPGQREDEFDIFSEFPWGSRGLGFITFFQNPPEYRHWTYDRIRRRVVPRTELDHSQDVMRLRPSVNEAPLQYWIRTNPNQAGRTAILTSLEAPEIDFTADRHRQSVGQPVNFTLIATGTVASVLWDFGDGTTSTEQDPAHVYTDAGIYDVTVTVVDRFGVEDTLTKVDFLEILNPPFADFVGDPTDGQLTPDVDGILPPGLNVSFIDLSVGTDDLQPTQWFWNFGDNQTELTTTQPTEEFPLVHRYTEEGFFSVTLEVTFTNATTSEEVVDVYKITDYITVRPCVGAGCQGAEGEGEGAEGEGEENPADLTMKTLVRDKEALVPLCDWVPLFQFSMSYPADTPAPRVLSSLTYTLHPDERDPDDLGYGNLQGPETSDILEFALFMEMASDDDAENQQLDVGHDFLLYTWDNLGAPLGEVISDTYLSTSYRLDFIGEGTADDPDFYLPALPDSDDGLKGASYIVAVRTSATWRSQLTMGCDVAEATMLLADSGTFPVNEELEPIDTYSPNFFDSESLDEDAAYSSSFAVWDIVGTPNGVEDSTFFNTWNRPSSIYTPAEEFTRPRWSKPDELLDIVAGTVLNVRRLMPIDEWVPVIGINAHSTKSLHMGYDAADYYRYTSSRNAAQLREVNLILTDIGGDPFGAQGNGGFNPNDGLHPVTTRVGVEVGDEDLAILKDVTFNGAWVWHDTNGNAIFDPPTPNAGGGASFNGDYPMFPNSLAFYEASETINFEDLPWEYIPLPPGGGDPWWKISLGFFWGRWRDFDSADDESANDGYLEPEPDNQYPDLASSASEYSNDYFVVIRTDSGFQDVSLTVPDGTGVTMGADFRAFIEPRRLNADGLNDGGIYMDSMIPAQGSRDLTFGPPWQEDERWGASEPWWNQRTSNENSAKPMRVGLEVHDLTVTYKSESNYRVETDIFFGDSPRTNSVCFGYALGGADYQQYVEMTDFDAWMDPFGLMNIQFLNNHSVGVTRWRLYSIFNVTIGGIEFALHYDETDSSGQFAYETVPFLNNVNGVDFPPTGPRSSVYSQPPFQPVLPFYDSWPGERNPGEYPRASDWREEDNQARLLTQKIDIASEHTAMLGINLVGSNDPFVLAGHERPSIAQISVAFWGPDFEPGDLQPVDERGRNYDSGVLLWQDADQSGAFMAMNAFDTYVEGVPSVITMDEVVPVRDLRWGEAPEPIDLDGDGAPDDMNGDGLVDSRDHAWVLSFFPEEQWVLPQSDDLVPNDYGWSRVIMGCGALNLSDKAADSGGLGDPEDAELGGDTKQGEGETDTEETDLRENDQPGDDLFITVRTSESTQSFEQFRAVIPATLPARAEGLRRAGIQFFPQVNTSASAFLKSSSDEDPVQDFFGHDMMEVNIPVRILDTTNQVQTVTIGGAAVSVLAFDLSTNRPENTLASGGGGAGGEASFSVSGTPWTPGDFAGDWLVDEGYETYEILDNSENNLVLRAGEPRDGRWTIVRDPSFLEEVVIEFYNEGTDADFNPLFDLLPLDIDQKLSGVALYRDNDVHGKNRNGLFDPDADIPLRLDARPQFIGQTGESTQVKFVFSSPGTDSIPVPIEQQARNRQWIPNSFGENVGDSEFGAEFFLVVRASQNMQENDNFRVGLVSWGPNTPTQPDPDTWARLEGEERNEFSKFVEFPWAIRGLGFISFFKEPQIRYFMDGAEAGSKADNSGFDWLRSHTTKKRRSSIITARPRPLSPVSVMIESVSESELPSQTLDGQVFSFVIRGEGFGSDPDVVLTGYDVIVTEATDTAIDVSVRTPKGGAAPVEPIVLIVRNPDTEEEASRSDLFHLVSGTTAATPVIDGVTPGSASAEDFPVTITGRNFSARENVSVQFGKTLMQVHEVSAGGDRITVGLPTGGLPETGTMDVVVRNTDRSTEDILVGGFDYLSDVQRQKFGSFMGCSGEPRESKASGVAGDALILLLVAGLVFVGLCRGFRRPSRAEENVD